MLSPYIHRALTFESIRYLLLGLVTFAIDFSTFFALTYGAELPYLYANAMAKTFGALFGFFMHRQFTFRGDKAHSTPKQFILYVLLYLWNVVFSSAAIYIFIDTLQFSVFWGKLLTDVLVILNAFLASKFIVFARGSTKTQETSA